jgi:hypothetical protein
MTDINIGVAAGGHSAVVHDEDGPRGVWVATFAIEAEDTAGHRWVWAQREFSNKGAAKSVLRHLDVGTPTTQPGRWFSITPRYGSDAWSDTDEFELACFEADAFDEPRPDWR